MHKSNVFYWTHMLAPRRQSAEIPEDHALYGAHLLRAGVQENIAILPFYAFPNNVPETSLKLLDYQADVREKYEEWLANNAPKISRDTRRKGAATLDHTSHWAVLLSLARHLGNVSATEMITHMRDELRSIRRGEMPYYPPLDPASPLRNKKPYNPSFRKPKSQEAEIAHFLVGSNPSITTFSGPVEYMATEASLKLLYPNEDAVLFIEKDIRKNLETVLSQHESMNKKLAKECVDMIIMHWLETVPNLDEMLTAVQGRLETSVDITKDTYEEIIATYIQPLMGKKPTDKAELKDRVFAFEAATYRAIMEGNEEVIRRFNELWHTFISHPDIANADFPTIGTTSIAVTLARTNNHAPDTLHVVRSYINSQYAVVRALK